MNSAFFMSGIAVVWQRYIKHPTATNYCGKSFVGSGYQFCAVLKNVIILDYVIVNCARIGIFVKLLCIVSLLSGRECALSGLK